MTALDRVIREMVDAQASLARRVRRLEASDTSMTSLQITGVFNFLLTEDCSPGDMSVTVNGVLGRAGDGMLWVAIDPFTPECEVRLVETISGSTLGFTTPLVYAHASGDAVMYSDSPLVNVRWFGAAGDNATDDTTAIVNAFAQVNNVGDGATLYFPGGTYLMSSVPGSVATVTINLRLIGDGIGKSVIVGDMASQFIVINNNFYMEGVTISTWLYGINASYTSSSLDYIYIVGCRFHNMQRGFYRNIPNDVTVQNLHIERCEFETMVNYAILAGYQIDSAHIVNNWFYDIGDGTGNAVAIELGNNEYDSQDEQGNYVIHGNTIRNLYGLAGEIHGILVYGYLASIVGNTIEDVDWSVVGASGLEGIYTKVRYSVIANNTLRDAGGVSGAISLKGSDFGNVDGTHGHSNVVIGNNLYCSGIADMTGVYVAVNDVLVSDNYFEGFTARSILVSRRSGDAAIVVRGNMIRRTTSSSGGIQLYSTGDVSGIVVEDNSIIGLDTPSGYPSGIYVLMNAGSTDLFIRNNYFEDFKLSGVSDGAGVYFNNDGGVLGTCEVVGNIFNGIKRGVRQTDSAITKLVVRNNRFYDCTTPNLTTSITTLVANDNYLWSEDGITFPVNDATPSVASKNGYYIESYTLATTITDFDDGVNGDVIVVFFTSNNPTNSHATVAHNANIKLCEKTNYNPPSNTVMTFIQRGGVWYELSRCESGAAVSASVSPSPSASRSPSASLSPSASVSRSGSASASRSVSPSRSPSASVSPSSSVSRSRSPSTSRSPSESPSASVSPSASPSLSPSASASPSASPSLSPSASASPST